MGERSCGFWFWLAVVSGRLCPPRPRGGAFGLSHPAAGLSRRWRAGLGCRPFPAVFAVLTGGPASGGIPCRMSNEPDSLLKPREIMFRTITLTGLAALLAATALTVATPAQAQIGTIFSDPPPLRPPGSIPRGGQPQPQPTPDDDEEVPELPPQGRVLPSRLRRPIRKPRRSPAPLPASASPSRRAGCSRAPCHRHRPASSRVTRSSPSRRRRRS